MEELGFEPRSILHPVASRWLYWDKSLLKIDHVSHVDIRETRVTELWAAVLRVGEVYLVWGWISQEQYTILQCRPRLFCLFIDLDSTEFQIWFWMSWAVTSSQPYHCLLSHPGEDHSSTSSVMTVSRGPLLLSLVCRPFTHLIESRNAFPRDKTLVCETNIK